MADNTCFNCKETLSKGAIVSVKRNLETVRNMNDEIDDDIDNLWSVSSVTVPVKFGTMRRVSTLNRMATGDIT